MSSRFLLTADAISSAVLGLGLFFFPHVICDFAFGRPTDGIHWHLIRCVGGQVFAGAFITARFRDSAPHTHTVCHLLRILPAILVLLLIFQCKSMTPELIRIEYLNLVQYFCFASLAFHISTMLYKGFPIGNQLIPNCKIGDGLYQLDSYASICIGAAWLTFPKWLLHRQVIVPMDESHELCGRLLGVLFVASHAISTHALHWPSMRDRFVAVDSRVVCCIAILSAQVWSQIAYPEAWSGGHWVGITLFSIWTVIALLYRGTLLVLEYCKKEKAQ